MDEDNLSMMEELQIKCHSADSKSEVLRRMCCFQVSPRVRPALFNLDHVDEQVSSKGTETEDDFESFRYITNLKNKGEILKIHEDSLKTAERHVKCLNEKNSSLQHQLTIKMQELNELRGCLKREKSETMQPPTPPVRDCVKGEINTLKSNLSAVQQLYRDCFYESAKQDQQIERLQNALAEMKTRDIEKSDEISRLENLLGNQKWTLNDCQDLIEEVESLKSEVNTTLDNINASTDCMFELQEENNSLKIKIGELEEQNARLQQQYSQDVNQKNKDSQKVLELLQLDKMLISEMQTKLVTMEAQIREKNAENAILEKEKLGLEMKISELEKSLHHQKSALTASQDIIENLKEKLREAKGQVLSKTSQLEILQMACQNHETTITTLKNHLDRAEVFVEENIKLRKDLAKMNNQSCFWRAQTLERDTKMKAMEDELESYKVECDQLQQLYQGELDITTTRSQEICTESKQFVYGVKCWMEKMKEKYRREKLRSTELAAENDSLRAKLRRYVRPRPQAMEGRAASEGFRTVKSDDFRLRHVDGSSESSDSYPPCGFSKVKIDGGDGQMAGCTQQAPRLISSKSASFNEDKHRMSNLIQKVRNSISNNSNVGRL